MRWEVAAQAEEGASEIVVVVAAVVLLDTVLEQLGRASSVVAFSASVLGDMVNGD